MSRQVGGRVNIGTTDTDYQGGHDSPRAVKEEVDEILAAINAYFPSAQLDPSDVITSWAGLRPLISDPKIKSTTDVSRKEEVLETPDGMISIAGGKLTTYRLMAEHGIDLAEKRLRQRGLMARASQSATRETPISGGEMSRAELADLAIKLAAEENLPRETAEHLVFSYGSEAPRLIELMREDERLREPLVPGLPHVAAEVIHAVRQEMALTPADVLTRRTRLAMLAGAGSLACAETVVKLMARELGWSEETARREAELYAEEFAAEYTTAD